MPILNIEPSSGTGNTSVQIGSSDYKGRANRSAAVRFQATSGDQPYIDVAVTQLGLGDLVNLDSSSASLEDEGGTVTITGTSNLASMLVSGFEGLNLTGASYTIDSGSEQTLAPSDEMIITPAGDPGKFENPTDSVGRMGIVISMDNRNRDPDPEKRLFQSAIGTERRSLPPDLHKHLAVEPGLRTGCFRFRLKRIGFITELPQALQQNIPPTRRNI